MQTRHPFPLLIALLSSGVMGGCGPAQPPPVDPSALNVPYTDRVIGWGGAKFSADLPCDLEPRGEATVDHTPFGDLRGQSYGCSLAGVKSYVFTVAVFDDPLPEGFDKADADAEVARKFVVSLCKAGISRGHGCKPGPINEEGSFTEVLLDITMDSGVHQGRVRVSYPYVAFAMVMGRADVPLNHEDTVASQIRLPTE